MEGQTVTRRSYGVVGVKRLATTSLIVAAILLGGLYYLGRPEHKYRLTIEVQTPGGDISRLVRSFPGLHVDSIDGTDFFASLRAMREATAYVRERKGPAFVHAHVIRPYSHSFSDDEKLYKTPA